LLCCLLAESVAIAYFWKVAPVAELSE